MFDQPRWHREALIPIATGVLFLWCAAGFGAIGFAFTVIPGAVLLATGLSTLLWPGDSRIPQFTALAGIVGVPVAVPVLLDTPLLGLVLIGLSAASFVSAGAISVRQEPHEEDVPLPVPGPRLSAQVAVDDALLATMQLSIEMKDSGDRARIRDEVLEARRLFEARGWLEKPESYHRTPPPLESVQARSRRAVGFDFEHVWFDSGYEPHEGEPGRERWLAYAPNRTAHAWVMRHATPGRPWLVCIHGYQMGAPVIDLPAFRPQWLHRRLGVNLLLPVLPLHGPRKIGRRSGDGFLAGDYLDSVHAEAQAMWDIRRLVGWVRAQEPDARIGVHGLSLGGYNASLLACLEDDLACAIPGIPATDFERLVWRHGPPLHVRHAVALGLERDDVRDVLRVVSPLVLLPKVPRERRYLFGAVADRLVPPDQVRDLWRHWEKPRIVWYQGAHVTFRLEPRVDELIETALRESGLAS
jgi:hypothetical protein